MTAWLPPARGRAQGGLACAGTEAFGREERTFSALLTVSLPANALMPATVRPPFQKAAILDSARVILDNPVPMLELGLKSLLAYLLGSLIGSLIVGQLRGGIDIRKLGSGNAGGTNALRTQGVGFAVWVMLIDIGKGWIATAWLPNAALPGIALDPTIARDWLTVACATGAVLGHVYPVWYGFRGGKGAATLIGVLVGIAPKAVLPLMLVWIIVVALTGFVGLGTMIAVAAFPAYLVVTSDVPSITYLTFGIAMTAFVCYTHRTNIERMRAGTESRASRLWLLKPR